MRKLKLSEPEVEPREPENSPGRRTSSSNITKNVRDSCDQLGGPIVNFMIF